MDKTALKVGSSFGVLWDFVDFQGGFQAEFGDFYKVIFSGIFGVSCWLSVGFGNILTFVCRKNKEKGKFWRKFASGCCDCFEYEVLLEAMLAMGFWGVDL